MAFARCVTAELGARGQGLVRKKGIRQRLPKATILWPYSVGSLLLTAWVEMRSYRRTAELPAEKKVSRVDIGKVDSLQGHAGPGLP